MSWEPVIGLEIHARLMTRTKLFCGCSTEFGALPNSQVCPVCLGYPGVLPVLNRRAVELAIRMAIATGCEVHQRSVFARKNYFYPDLPKGYQISQFDQPLATSGEVAVNGRAVRIQRIHIEEDAGKLLHRTDATYVDLNRAGTPLIEIVSEPDLESAEEAAGWFAGVRQILMYCGVCDGNMEEGSLRCDANVSLHRSGDTFGTRVEIKNLNSFRFLSRAIEHEIERQTAVLESGGRVIQETRLFDSRTLSTQSMRTKEEAHDYRYFPEPDLPPLQVDAPWVESIRRAIPELPQARSARYQRDWGIAPVDADAIVVERALAEYFEGVVAATSKPRPAANWVRNDLLRLLHEEGVSLETLPVSPQMLGRLIDLVEEGAIGSTAGREVFAEMVKNGETADVIVERSGLAQISDRDRLRELAASVVAAHPTQAGQYRNGKTQLFGFFVGQLMKATGGKANAALGSEILREILDADGSAPH